MIERIDALIREGQSLAFETTCASKRRIRTMERAKKAGYRVTLVFLWLPSPEAAIARVARRVREGGHHIPDTVVTRRYWSGIKNMVHLYLPAADYVSINDSSDGNRIVIADRAPPEQLIVHDQERWAKIEGQAR